MLNFLMWTERGKNGMSWHVMEDEKGGLSVRWRISHDDPVTYIFSPCLTWQGGSKTRKNS